MFADAMATVLSRHGYTVAVSRTIAGTLTEMRRRKPDICLLDRYFAGTDSIEMVGKLHDASPDTKILVLSADPGSDGVLRALQSGAAGYLHKSRGVGAVTTAIDRVRRGEIVVDVPPATAGQRSQQGDHLRRLAGYLSPRERDCLRLLVEGSDTADMAAKLGVSRATVRTHVQAMLTKLGVHSRLEAASLAVRHALLRPPEPDRSPGSGR